MRQYELLEAMTFKHGRFKLTPEQLANRKYVTRFVGDPVEMTVEPIVEISFKRGETIVTDLEIPRALESKLLPLAPEQPATESEPSESTPVEPVASGSTDPAAGGSDASDSDGAPSTNADDPLANLDIGGSSPSGVDTPTEQKPGKRSRGK